MIDGTCTPDYTYIIDHESKEAMLILMQRVAADYADVVTHCKTEITLGPETVRRVDPSWSPHCIDFRYAYGVTCPDCGKPVEYRASYGPRSSWPDKVGTNLGKSVLHPTPLAELTCWAS